MGSTHREQRPAFLPPIIYCDYALRLGNHIAIAVHVARRNVAVGDYLHAIAGSQQSMKLFVLRLQPPGIGDRCF